MTLGVFIPEEIKEFISQGAIFYISHSGGKDSQAMYALLKTIVPDDQIVVVHADLGVVEWLGVQDHIQSNITHPLNVVRANKTFLEMVERRGMWPSAAYRQCTSDLKRGPINKFIRNDTKKRKATIAVNCMGIRAQESSARAKKTPFKKNIKESCHRKVVRSVYDWLPIFFLPTAEVFQTIRDVGQEPFWAYKKNERLSCVFCIMGSVNDLRHGAECRPELFKTYLDLEKNIGHTLFMKGKVPIPLDEYIGMNCNTI